MRPLSLLAALLLSSASVGCSSVAPAPEGALAGKADGEELLYARQGGEGYAFVMLSSAPLAARLWLEERAQHTVAGAEGGALSATDRAGVVALEVPSCRLLFTITDGALSVEQPGDCRVAPYDDAVELAGSYPRAVVADGRYRGPAGELVINHVADRIAFSLEPTAEGATALRGDGIRVDELLRGGYDLGGGCRLALEFRWDALRLSADTGATCDTATTAAFGWYARAAL